jgi:hypothetical protein
VSAGYAPEGQSPAGRFSREPIKQSAGGKNGQTRVFHFKKNTARLLIVFVAGAAVLGFLVADVAHF